jgi:hypothetical protein
MGGRQCSKKLWQTVYDPEPGEEALPGTVKGMGIEVGVKARLLWPGGILIDSPYDDYAEALRRTEALIADQLFRRSLRRRWCMTVCSFELMLSNAFAMAAGDSMK